MRIITSDELGALKLFDLTLGDNVNAEDNNSNNTTDSTSNVKGATATCIGKTTRSGRSQKTMDSLPICPPDLSMSRGNGITSLDWFAPSPPPPPLPPAFVVGRMGPSLELWDEEKGGLSMRVRVDLFGEEGGEGEGDAEGTDRVLATKGGGGEGQTCLAAMEGGGMYKVDFRKGTWQIINGGRPVVGKPPQHRRSKSSKR